MWKKKSQSFLSGVCLVMEKVTKAVSHVMATETLCISYSSPLHGKCVCVFWKFEASYSICEILHSLWLMHQTVTSFYDLSSCFSSCFGLHNNLACSSLCFMFFNCVQYHTVLQEEPGVWVYTRPGAWIPTEEVWEGVWGSVLCRWKPPGIHWFINSIILMQIFIQMFSQICS